MKIWFYHREAHVGDYVFADGSYSDVINKNKTVVGVCFYVNPNNKSERLCVGPTNLARYGWGTFNNTTTWPEGIVLADSPALNAFDIPTLVNKASSGMSSNYITEADYRDEFNGDADGFRIFPENVYLGELGLTQNTTPLGGYEVGQMVPWGLANTLKIIEHRNKILSDSNIQLQIPAQVGSQSEYDNLIQLLETVALDNTKYQQLYFAVASLCYAYTPTIKAGEKLAESLSLHHWFLPSEAELARIYWYYAHGTIYNNAIGNSLFSQFTNGMYWSSTEHTASYAGIINFTNGLGGNNGQGRTQLLNTRPIAAF